MSLQLRPYQEAALNDIARAFRAGKRAPLCVLPTGGGKTILAGEAARRHVNRSPTNHVLMCVHRTELLSQSRDKLEKFGLTVRTIQGSNIIGRPDANATVAMIPTLAGDGWRDRLPRATFVIIDECHHAKASTWARIAGAYSGAHILGLTATPERSDGKPLGDIFDEIIPVVSVRELVAIDALVPCRVYAPPSAGTVLADDAADLYLREGRDRKCVIFCQSVAHARDVAARIGPKAVCVEGTLAADERHTRLRAFANGVARVVTNCAVLTEGWDDPGAEMLIMARGAEHAGLWLQCVGRVLRPSPGKTQAEVYDLRGVVHRHGLPDDDRVYSLDGKPISTVAKLPSIMQCMVCHSVYRAAPRCPVCFTSQPMPELPEVRRQRLAEVRAAHTEDQRAATLRRLQQEGASKGYKPGWAWMRYRAMYGGANDGQ